MIDEAGTLDGLLADLATQRNIRLQCVVVDGGSVDQSRTIARNAGAEVVCTPAGRAVQMNAGARVATGDWLCFVHADSRLTDPDQLCSAIERLAASGEQQVAGHFALRFAGDLARSRFFYRYLEAKTATNRRYTINGDQGLLLRRTFFAALGGFDEKQPFLEDQRMAAAVSRAGRWCLLPHPLVTSARRFETEGRVARYLLMALIMAMYIAPVPAFFARAPDVYARQAETGRLRLMPYFQLLWRLMRDCGARHSLVVCWRVADLALSQAWQLGLVLDVALGRARQMPCTRFYERYLRVLVEQPLMQAWLLALLLGTVFGPLQLWFVLRETPRLNK